MRFFSRMPLAAALVAVMVLPSAVPAAFAQDAASDGSTVVARVNGEDITEADLALAAQDFRQTLSQLPPEQRLSGLINGVIDIRLMARAAEAAGLEKDPAAAQRLAFIRDRALRSEYIRANVVGAVTDEQVRKLYDETVAAFVPEEQVRASHILLPTEEAAKDVIAELDKGADFAELAKTKSLDLGSGANGGDLGFFGKGAMVPEFETAAFALEPGTYTKTPVQSQHGWHVILLTEKGMSSPPAFEAVEDDLRNQVAQRLFVEALDKLRADAKIELVEPPPAPDAPAADAPAADAPAEPAPQ